MINIFGKNKNKKDDKSAASSSGKNMSLFDEIATQKTAGNYQAFLEVLPNPDIVLRKKGLNIKVYRELSSDGDVGGCIDSRKSGVTSLLWSIDGDKNSKCYQVIEDLFSRINIYDLIEDILNAPLYGYQPIEIMWEVKDGLFLPKDLIAKPQEWFCFDSNNEFRLKSKGKTTLIPENKFLLPRNKASYINPYGEAVLSRVFWNVVFKKNGYKFWVKFIEKYGTPSIWGTVPRNASEQEQDDLLETLENMVQDAVAVITEGTQIDIKEAAGKGDTSNVYDTFTNRCVQNISKSILGQTLTTQIDGTGSYAASQTHNEVRKDIIASDKRLVEATINHLIGIIDTLNFNSPALPKFEMYEEEDVDTVLAERDKTLTDQGVRFTKTYYTKTYGFDDNDLEVVDITQNNTNNTSNFADGSDSSEIKTKDDFQTRLDKFIDTISDDELQSQFKETLKPVLTVFNETKKPQDALEKLQEIYSDMSFNELEKQLTKIIFASECIGRLEAGNE